MKKLSSILVLFLIFTLCGCSLIPTGATASDVETLKGWSFQYNKGTNDYSVFFALLTKSDRYVSADVDVDIRVVNDDGTEVYRATHSVNKDDFGYYSSQAAHRSGCRRLYHSGRYRYFCRPSGRSGSLYLRRSAADCKQAVPRSGCYAHSPGSGGHPDCWLRHRLCQRFLHG